MSIKVGLVGLPNVGKSTLFNALTKSCVPAHNFPFCTIDSNVAVVAVPDHKLEFMAKVFGSKKMIPATIEFVDIAGLVKGASKGEGLGNKFLSHIAEVDLVVNVLRCFNDNEVIHVQNEINPLGDFQTITCELMFKDLDCATKRIDKLGQLIKKAGSDQKAKALCEKELGFLNRVVAAIEALDHKSIRAIAHEAKKEGLDLNLLSGKNFLIAANLDEASISKRAFVDNQYYKSLVEEFGEERVVPICAKMEADLVTMEEADANELRAEMGIDATGLVTLVKKAFSSLNLICFFTCGPQEAHAWPIQAGTKAPQAAGEIHSDLQRGFICAQVYNYSDLEKYGTEAKVQDAGKVRTEGKDYVIVDGDLVVVKFNV